MWFSLATGVSCLPHHLHSTPPFCFLFLVFGYIFLIKQNVKKSLAFWAFSLKMQNQKKELFIYV